MFHNRHTVIWDEGEGGVGGGMFEVRVHHAFGNSICKVGLFLSATHNINIFYSLAM